MAGEQTAYDGLAIEDILPVTWEFLDFSSSAALEHANEDTARALQAIAVYEETPRAPKEDLVHMASETSRLEAKLDLVLSLLSNIVSEAVGMPESRAMVLRNGSIEWQLAQPTETARGDMGVACVWINTHIPLPLRLPCRVDGTIERNGFTWAQARFEYLAPNVRDGLGQVIFRHHRRQVAIARGTITVPRRELM
jgi:Atypical PilZ domain, cyclic di-GMP receptor